MKNKLVNGVLLFLVAILYVSCATSKISRETSEDAKNMQPPDGKSLVYIYRTSAMGFAVGLRVDLNNNRLGDFYPKRYFLCTLDPGKYVFTGIGENQDDLILTTEPGKKYYIKVKPKMGFAIARVGLELIHPTEGNSDIQKCRMIGSMDNISPFAAQPVTNEEVPEVKKEMEQKQIQPKVAQSNMPSYPVSSNSASPQYSVKAGFNLSELKTVNKSDYDRLKPGFHIGGAVAFPISEYLAVEPGLLFSTKGESYKYSGINSSNNLNYLEIPINGIYQVNIEGLDFLLNAGPYLGISLGGKRKTSNDGNITKVKLEPETIDYGLNAGASLLIDSYSFGLQYGLGLANVFENAVHNRVISLAVGYKLGTETGILNLKNNFSGNKQFHSQATKPSADYNSATPISNSENIDQKKGSVGAGIGVAYGVIGINGEYAIHDYVSLSAGVGTTIIAGVGYAVGGRIYAKPLGEKWRPRLSAHYGTNSIIDISGAVEIQKKYNGLAIGAGFLQMFGSSQKTGLDLEVVYLATQGDFQNRAEALEDRYDVTLKTGRVKILVGYRIAF